MKFVQIHNYAIVKFNKPVYNTNTMYIVGIETAACIGGGFYVLKVYKFTIT